VDIGVRNHRRLSLGGGSDWRYSGVAGVRLVRCHAVGAYPGGGVYLSFIAAITGTGRLSLAA
jgi:hypothetical protein